MLSREVNVSSREVNDMSSREVNDMLSREVNDYYALKANRLITRSYQRTEGALMN